MSASKRVDLKKLIRQDVRSMHAYAIQDSVGMVKLDAMENPHRLPAALQAHLGQRLGALALNRYPDGRVTSCARRWPNTRRCPKVLTSCWAMARTN